jgi:diaminohydroxyphosphoribosylaminopyrimidine deaminase / 5-amino-6-(5-phosphoribosylamino)uracil reductase
LGEGAVPFAAGVGSPFLLEQTMRSISRRDFGGDVCVEGHLRDAWG